MQIIKSSENQTIKIPLFPNTDIPLACLFIHLEHGYTISQFLQDFPSVSEEQVQGLFELAIEIFKKPDVCVTDVVSKLG